MICWENRYLNVPGPLLGAAESLMQGIITHLHDITQLISERLVKNEPQWFGDLDYKLTLEKGEFKHWSRRQCPLKRVVLDCACAQWWAVIEFNNEALLVYAQLGSCPTEIPSWEELTQRGLDGEAQLYGEFTRSLQDINTDYYCDYTRFSLTHPLMFHLTSALNELKENEPIPLRPVQSSNSVV
jgi:hypothetical protein